MEIPLSVQEVTAKIRQMEENGQPLGKKKVKQAHPDLMLSALYYFPSWEYAVQSSTGTK
ncbi:hypothetical protein [Laceyella putida]|uniref:Transposase n=1 Tax=Laceyella putida TaxID=110101 RepID=A0ABW2RMA8_9BACL